MNLLAVACLEAAVFFNANLHTGAATPQGADAILVEEGRIRYVGPAARAMRRAPRDARRVDLHGATVVPGFTDAHAHLAGIGFRELEFDLEGTTSLEDLQRRLAARAASTNAPWITGRGWIESRWQPAEFPTRTALDAVVSDRPVFLMRADGHAAVANSRALALAGIDAQTADPAGGQILRDANGVATGMLVDGAVELVGRLVPPPGEAEELRALELGAARSVRLGWTQLQIAGNTRAEVDRLCALYRDGRIRLRLYDAVGGPGPDAAQLLAGETVGPLHVGSSVRQNLAGRHPAPGQPHHRHALAAERIRAEVAHGVSVRRTDDQIPPTTAVCAAVSPGSLVA